MLSRRIIPGVIFAIGAAVVPGRTVRAQRNVTQNPPAQSVASQTYAIADSTPFSSEQGESPERPPVRQLDDEVQLVAPVGPVMLAHQFELKLAGETNALRRISVTQWSETANGQWREIYQGFWSGPGMRRGDAVVLTVIPYHLGRVQLRVTGTGKPGEDLELLHKDVWIDVAAPAAGPVELRFGQARHEPWADTGSGLAMAKIGLKRGARPLQMDLSVKGIYDGVLEPQPLSVSRVQYRVRTGEQGAVIALDERTGLVRGLKAGHALVEVLYDGMTKQACVIVEGARSARADCRDLVGR